MPPTTALKPLSTCTISAVTPAARSDSRNAAVLPTSSIVTLRLSGALLFDELENLAEALDAARRQRLDRAR